jgi:hypothetical protein
VSPTELANAVALFGPGFIFWKVLSLSGAQHRRLEWEWIVWSVLTSLPIAAVSIGLRALLAPAIDVGEPLATYLEQSSRFVLAAAVGVIAGWMWRRTKRSRRPWAVRLQRSVRDSAWDLVLDEASAVDKGKLPLFGVCLTVEFGGVRESYYGKVGAFGYEAAEAEPWIYLKNVQHWEPGSKQYVEMVRTEGVLFHREKILRLRVVTAPEQPEQPEPLPGASAIS